ncbi:hypothetical protein C9939_05080, partial [Pseudidiomarina aestuarii]
TTMFYVLDTSYSETVNIERFKPTVEVSLESHSDGRVHNFLFPDLPVFYLERNLGTCFYQTLQGSPNVLLKSKIPNKALTVLDDQKDGVIDNSDVLHKLIRFIEPSEINGCVGQPQITSNDYDIAINTDKPQRINQQIDNVKVHDRVRVSFDKEGEVKKGAWLYSIELTAK